MKIIVGLLPPDRGEVWIDGKLLAQLSAAERYQLRKNIGFVFQGASGAAAFGNLCCHHPRSVLSNQRRRYSRTSAQRSGTVRWYPSGAPAIR